MSRPVALGLLGLILSDQRFLGNVSGAAGPPVEITAAQAKTLLAIARGDISGLAAVRINAFQNFR